MHLVHRWYVASSLESVDPAWISFLVGWGVGGGGVEIKIRMVFKIFFFFILKNIFGKIG